MNRFDQRILWGLLLILGGVVFLLQNLGMIEFDNLIYAAILGAIGVTFLVVLFSDRSRWWAVIPGLILTYLSALLFMERFAPSIADRLGGPLFLLAIAVSFWVVYLLNRKNWWAIIPAGVLTTLALVSSWETLTRSEGEGGIFFLGIGLTFGLLALIPTDQGRMRWPLIPAVILTVMGLVILTLSESFLNFIWPVGLILAGLYLFFFRGRQII